MVTRRQTLGGLAGIIAAGTAPAAVVRSMIGARGAAMFGGAKKDQYHGYVGDGLIAYWDGIDNVGDGDLGHDSSAKIWKDLTGNAFDWTLTNYGTFESNCLKCNGLSAESDVGITLGVGYTQEFVFTNYNNYGGISWIYNVDSYNFRQSPIIYRLYTVIGGGRMGIVSSSYGIHSISCAVKTLAKTNTSITWNNEYIDGESTTSQSRGDWWGYWHEDQVGSISIGRMSVSGTWSGTSSGYAGRLYCIRVYNRALTEAEVFANYEVDRLRFCTL